MADENVDSVTLSEGISKIAITYKDGIEAVSATVVEFGLNNAHQLIITYQTDKGTGTISINLIQNESVSLDQVVVCKNCIGWLLYKTNFLV